MVHIFDLVNSGLRFVCSMGSALDSVAKLGHKMLKHPSLSNNKKKKLLGLREDTLHSLPSESV